MFIPGILSHWNCNWWNYSVENTIDVQVEYSLRCICEKRNIWRRTKDLLVPPTERASGLHSAWCLWGFCSVSKDRLGSLLLLTGNFWYRVYVLTNVQDVCGLVCAEKIISYAMFDTVASLSCNFEQRISSQTSQSQPKGDWVKIRGSYFFDTVSCTENWTVSNITVIIFLP